MVDFKLEDAIKSALQGKYFGNNKVIVETDTLGQIHIYDYDEDSKEERINELEEENAELETENELLQDQIEELETKIEKLENSYEE